MESRGKGAESYNVFAVCLSKQASKSRKNTPGNNVEMGRDGEEEQGEAKLSLIFTNKPE